MLEPSLTSQLLGAGSIAVSFFVAGFMTCYLEVKKKEKEQRKEKHADDIYNQYIEDLETNHQLRKEAEAKASYIAWDSWRQSANLYTE
mgnify:CR=1 FL=1